MSRTMTIRKGRLFVAGLFAPDAGLPIGAGGGVAGFLAGADGFWRWRFRRRGDVRAGSRDLAMFSLVRLFSIAAIVLA